MYEYKARVDKVTDGDTLDITIDLGFDVFIKEKVRLYGIDTPESRTRDKVQKEYGLKAKQYVKDRLDGKDITISTKEKGKFGRYLATIWYDNNELSLNDELVKEGLARPYYGGKKEEWVFT